METITYSLKTNQNSDYYKDISIFTDDVLIVSENFLKEIITEFQSFLQTDGKFSSEKYLLELLMLGTFWRIYGGRASNLGRKSQKILAKLGDLRIKKESFKTYVDPILGILCTLFLQSEKGNTMELTIENLDKLLKYLEASGEFRQELNRLKIWKNFFKSQKPQKIKNHLKNILIFADWFKVSSKTVIGRYTTNVEKFLNEKHPQHRWKEDVVFCGRERTEYHLNMVGAEIMNRYNRKKFENRPRKALILPGCIRSKNESNCRALDTKIGLRCTGCLKGCTVNQLRKLGKENNFEVYIISHESTAFSKINKKDKDELAIVGVACVLNLISGGLKSESLGIPAQCVLLDYSSCKNHWHKEGYPTEIDIGQLMKIMSYEKVSLNLNPLLTIS